MNPSWLKIFGQLAIAWMTKISPLSLVCDALCGILSLHHARLQSDPLANPAQVPGTVPSLLLSQQPGELLITRLGL